MKFSQIHQGKLYKVGYCHYLTLRQNYLTVELILLVGVLLWFGLCFVMAEMIRRLCLFSEEIHHLRTRYDESWSRLLLHVFNFRNSANFVTLLILLALLFVSTLFTPFWFFATFSIDFE